MAEHVELTTKMGTSKEAKIDEPCLAYRAMQADLEMARDLREGTPTMRARGIRYAPRFPAEEVEDYQSRIDQTFLHPMFENAIERVASKPFSKAMDVDIAALPEPLDAIVLDVDGRGTDLGAFAQKLVDQAAQDGLVHVLVTHPPRVEGQTVDFERERGIRPRFETVPALALIGWDPFEGSEDLREIRIQGTRTRRVGAWGQEPVDVIRVWRAPPRDQAGRETGELGVWEVWEQGEKDKDFLRVDAGTHTYPGIPLETLYFKRTGHMTAALPFGKVAWTAVAHWQSSSRQRFALNQLRLPTMLGKGWPKDQPLRLGGWNAIEGDDVDLANVDVKYVEHTGAALTAGERDLDKLEQIGEDAGMEPFRRASGQMTATAELKDEHRSRADVLRWVRNTEKFLALIFWVAGRWRDVEIPEDWLPNIYSEFGLTTQSSTNLAELREDFQAGAITHARYLSERKRYGLYGEDFDPDDEAQAAREQAQVVAVAQRPPRDPGDTGEEEAA